MPLTDEQLDNWFTYHTPTTDEDCARALYTTWKDQDGWVPWVPGGNSTKQDEARSLTRGQATAPKYAAIRAAEFECHRLLGELETNVAQMLAEGFTNGGATASDCERVNAATRNFVKTIDANAPDSADKTAAIRCVRLARNAANEWIMHLVSGFPLYIDNIGEARRQLVLARWQANSAIACKGK